MAFVSGGRLWSMPVDTSAAPTAPPFELADDFPEAASWVGDSRHLISPDAFRVQARAGRRRQRRSHPDPDAVERQSTARARRRARGTRRRRGVRGPRGESDIVVENGIITEVSAHRDDLHVGSVVDATAESGDARPGRHARASDARVRRQLRAGRARLRHHQRPDTRHQRVRRARAARVVRVGTASRSTGVHGRQSDRGPARLRAGRCIGCVGGPARSSPSSARRCSGPISSTRQRGCRIVCRSVIEYAHAQGCRSPRRSVSGGRLRPRWARTDGVAADASTRRW